MNISMTGSADRFLEKLIDKLISQSAEHSKFSDVIAKFRVKRVLLGRAQLFCPTHEDNEGSLSAGIGNGSIVLKCHAGCDIYNVLAAVGLKLSDLFIDFTASKSHTEKINQALDHIHELRKLIKEIDWRQ